MYPIQEQPLDPPDHGDLFTCFLCGTPKHVDDEEPDAREEYSYPVCYTCWAEMHPRQKSEAQAMSDDEVVYYSPPKFPG